MKRKFITKGLTLLFSTSSLFCTNVLAENISNQNEINSNLENEIENKKYDVKTNRVNIDSINFPDANLRAELIKVLGSSNIDVSNVISLNLVGNFNTVKGLELFSNLEELTIDNTNQNNDIDLSYLNNNSLKKIHLINCGIQKDKFLNTTYLEDLTYESCKITDIFYNLNAPNLKNVLVDNCYFFDFRNVLGIANYKNLETFVVTSLSSNKGQPILSLVGMNNLTKLKVLDVIGFIFNADELLHLPIPNDVLKLRFDEHSTFKQGSINYLDYVTGVKWYTNIDRQEEYKFMNAKQQTIFVAKDNTINIVESRANLSYTFNAFRGLPTPKQQFEGYSEDGWYTSKTFETSSKVLSHNDLKKGDTIYLKHSPNKYIINYNLNGGFGDSEQEVIYDDTYNLQTPTKTGFTFEGWYIDSGFINKYNITDIWKATDNLNLFAKWQPDVNNSNNNNNNNNNNNIDSSSGSVSIISKPIKENINEENTEKRKENYFEDIENHWAENDINSLVDKQLIFGFKKQFRPNDYITRADVSVIISRILGKELGKEITTKNNIFLDVYEENYYYNEINNIASLGLIKGYGNNYFKPNNKISREEFFSILDRTVNYLNLDLKYKAPINFIDENEISWWAKESIQSLNYKGLVYGNNSRLNPKDNITRAEVVSLLNRLLENIG